MVDALAHAVSQQHGLGTWQIDVMLMWTCGLTAAVFGEVHCYGPVGCAWFCSGDTDSLAASRPAWLGHGGSTIRMAQCLPKPRQHDDRSSCMVLWVDLCNYIRCHRRLSFMHRGDGGSDGGWEGRGGGRRKGVLGFQNILIVRLESSVLQRILKNNWHSLHYACFNAIFSSLE